MEKIIEHHNSDYNDFQMNFISIRAVDRDLMIIGEAIGKINEDVKITSAKHIIGLRNLIVHAYDSVNSTALWRILIIELPVLKQEVQILKYA